MKTKNIPGEISNKITTLQTCKEYFSASLDTKVLNVTFTWSWRGRCINKNERFLLWWCRKTALFYPAEILSSARSVLLQMNLFLFCTVCSRLIKISPVSWLHEEGRTPNKWGGRTPLLCSPPCWLSPSPRPWALLSSSFIGLGELLQGWLPSTTHPPHSALHLFCESLVEFVYVCMSLCASGSLG